MTGTEWVRAIRRRLPGAIVALVVAATLAAAAPPLEARRGPKRRTVVYEVRRGDTLSKIAKKFRVTPKQIRRWNRLKSDRIIAGRTLRIATPVRRRSAAMKDAVRMPDGPGWYLKNPEESWGTPHTIAVITEALTAWRAKHPDAPPIVVGDVSRKEGGYFPPHRSHRDGRDLDLGLPPRGDRELTYFARLGREMDPARAWDLLCAFLDTGEVELVLLDIRLQRRLHRYAAKERGVPTDELRRIFQWPRSRRTRVGLVRHSRGHADHFHIRIRKPSPDAVAEAAADDAAAPDAEVLEGPPRPPASILPASDEPTFTSAP